MKISQIIKICVLVLLPSVSIAEDLYVDSAEPTSGDGTINSPWKELSNIEWGSSVGQFGTGDTLYLSGGSTFSSKQYSITAQLNFSDIGGVDGSDPRRTYVKVWPDPSHDGTVIIDGGDNITGVDNEGDTTYGRMFQIKHADYLTIDGEVNGERHIRLQNWGRTGWFGDPSVISGLGANTPIRDTVIRYIEIINDDVTCPEPTGSPGDPEYDLFDGCMYDGTGSHAEWNNADWNYERKDCMYIGTMGEGSIIEHNYLDGCVSVAMYAYVSGASDFGLISINNNEIKGYRDEDGHGGPDGIKGCGGADIHDNKVYHVELVSAAYNPNHAAEDGIQINPGNNYIRIYNNLLYGYSQGPIRFDPGTAAGTASTNYIHIWNNDLQARFTGGAVPIRGIALDGQTNNPFVDVKIFNNTITGFPTMGIRVSTHSAVDVDVEIKNNLLIDSVMAESYDVAPTGQLVDADYNLVINSDGSQAGNDYPQAHDPWDADGTLNFVSYTIPTTTANTIGNDLHLAEPSSMAIGAGVALGSPYDIDAEGVTRSVPWDLGAYGTGGAPEIITHILSGAFSGAVQ